MFENFLHMKALPDFRSCSDMKLNVSMRLNSLKGTWSAAFFIFTCFGVILGLRSSLLFQCVEVATSDNLIGIFLRQSRLFDM